MLGGVLRSTSTRLPQDSPTFIFREGGPRMLGMRSRYCFHAVLQPRTDRGRLEAVCFSDATGSWVS